MAAAKPMFWKPGEARPGLKVDKDTQEEGETLVYNPDAASPLEQQRRRLPIYDHSNQILYALEKHRVLLVLGETGSGKTTQIPQYLLSAGWATKPGEAIVCTQPRRVACLSIAQRVAVEQGCEVGGRVGYHIRFDHKADPMATKIKFLTDGMLVREIAQDPLLSKYPVIMVDEAHERSVSSDILLGLLKYIMRRRPDLRLVISSATMDVAKLAQFFSHGITTPTSNDEGEVQILSVEGTSYPVSVNFLKEPSRNYVQSTVDCVMDIHISKPPGDVLVFFPGREEILGLADRLKGLVGTKHKLSIVPLYAGLSGMDQMKAFSKASPGYRKVIISTNMAETSVTLPDIVYVIDSGLVKVKAFDPSTSAERLVPTCCSRAEAIQRAGRAGRLRPGYCFRMYQEEFFTEEMPEHPVPEVLRTGLAPTIVQLKGMGIENPARFEFVSPPTAPAMAQGLELLHSLGAIDDKSNLTEGVGEYMADFPCDPCMARFLLVADAVELGSEACAIGGMLSVCDIWLTGPRYRERYDASRRTFGVREGDHITYLNMFGSYVAAEKSDTWCKENALNPRALQRADEVRKHLLKTVKRARVKRRKCGLALCDTIAIEEVAAMDCEEHEDTPTLQLLLASIASAYFPKAAIKQADGTYRSVHGGLKLHMHYHSILSDAPPEWIIFNDINEMGGKMIVRDCVALHSPEWLQRLAPHFYQYRSQHARIFGLPPNPAGPRRCVEEEGGRRRTGKKRGRHPRRRSPQPTPPPPSPHWVACWRSPRRTSAGHPTGSPSEDSSLDNKPPPPDKTTTDFPVNTGLVLCFAPSPLFISFQKGG